MRKLTAILLAVLLVLGTVPTWCETTSTEDLICGFEVIETGTFPLVNAETTLLKHQKTGAQVLIIKNNDTNRLFDLSFVTPAETDMGTSHVFEHATTSGSEKYPSQAVFFNLLYRTYNTYMNAFTMAPVTTYPIASLSEEQLLKYADFYTDSCFNPILMDNENIFLEEAWRYSLDSAEDELTINGTVYSEMMGSYNISEAAQLNLGSILFPGSYAGNCFGGKPSEIPNLTLEDLTDYHKRFYHPSNSLALLYGDIEHPEAFLELLDSYYSVYDEKEFTRETGDDYVPISGYVTKNFDFAAEANSNLPGIVYFGIVCDTTSEEVLRQLDLWSSLFSSNTSPIYRTMLEKFPSGTFSCWLEYTGPEPAIYFTIDGIDNPEDAEAFRTIILDGLNEFVENGFNADALAAEAAATRLDVALIMEDSDIGANIASSLAYDWAVSGNVNSYFDFVNDLDNIELYNENGTYQNLVKTYLLKDDVRSALALTLPTDGLAQKEAIALAKHLADVKAAMSEEEIAAIVEQTARFGSMNDESGDASEYVAQLQAVTVDSLPEEIRFFETTDETDENGIRYITAQADVNGIGEPLIFLNAASFDQEELMWFKLYTDLLGAIDTEKHTADELSPLLLRYFYDAVIRVSILTTDTESGFTPYLRSNWICTEEDLGAAYDLLYELLFETKFDDGKRVRNEVSALRSSLANEFDEESYMIQLYRAMATSDPAYACFNYLNYVDYADFLTRLDRTLATKPEEVLSKLRAVQQKLFNSTNAIAAYIGSEEGMELNKPYVDAFLARLDKVPAEDKTNTYVFPEISAREGIIINSPVKYNLIYASLEDLGLEERSGALDAVTALVTDAYLLPMLRDQYGTYSVFHSADEAGMYIISYADPNVDKTFAVYELLPELIAGLEIDQETLNGYILSSYAQYALSQGELSGALYAVLDVIEGLDQNRYLDYMKALKEVKAEDIAEYAAVYQALIDNGIRSTAGSKTAIFTFSDLFDSIITPNL